MHSAEKRFEAGWMEAFIFESGQELAKAAAENTAEILCAAIAARGQARMIVATGNSQLGFVEALYTHEEVPWDRVTVFHLDEYVGIESTHTASFRRWIYERIDKPLRPAMTHYINGEAEDVESECRRYEELLNEAPNDLVCMGIGENGHIAFNEPHVADFEDPDWVKTVELDEASRQQQVNEEHFASVEEVPKRALSLTIPALVSPRSLQVVVPGRRKATAVQRTVEEQVHISCPATILQRQPHAQLLLDTESACQLSGA